MIDLTLSFSIFKLVWIHPVWWILSLWNVINKSILGKITPRIRNLKFSFVFEKISAVALLLFNFVVTLPDSSKSLIQSYSPIFTTHVHLPQQSHLFRVIGLEICISLKTETNHQPSKGLVSQSQGSKMIALEQVMVWDLSSFEKSW